MKEKYDSFLYYLLLVRFNQECELDVTRYWLRNQHHLSFRFYGYWCVYNSLRQRFDVSSWRGEHKITREVISGKWNRGRKHRGNGNCVGDKPRWDAIFFDKLRPLSEEVGDDVELNGEEERWWVKLRRGYRRGERVCCERGVGEEDLRWRTRICIR